MGCRRRCSPTPAGAGDERPGPASLRPGAPGCATAWLFLGFVAVVMLFGDVLQTPAWLTDISPFRHLAMVPAEDFRLLVVVLLAMAAALTSAAQLSLSMRDIK